MSKKEIATTANEEVLAQLRQSFPTDPGVQRFMLPRINMASQDKTEGKGKNMKVVTEAGTFFLEAQGDEIDEETGKKIWIKDEIGASFEGIIIFQRKQLKYYDEVNNKFASTPIYDNDDEIIPLFADKKEIKRGTPQVLKGDYNYVDKDGKTKCRLEDNRILYVLYKEEMYQMNLRGSSMWSFRSYVKSVNPSEVVTKCSSEAKEKGSIAWNQMTFKIARNLNQEEAESVLAKVKEIQSAILMEKAAYTRLQITSTKADEEMDEIVNSADKQLR